LFPSVKTLSTTLEHIARKVGVSSMTVSRALRDSALVSPRTKQKILKAAQELEYTPNLLARSLAQHKSPFIGLIVTELSNPFFAPVITAIQEIARQQNYFVTIGDSESRIDIQNALLEHFQQIQISGLILTPLTADWAILETMQKTGTPMVVIARRWEKGDYVTADNVMGGCMVAEHLLQLGHLQIACITLRGKEHTAVVDRVRGFRETLREAKTPLLAAHTLRVDSLTYEEGVRAADEFLKLSPRPTAAFVVADRLAVGFIDRLTAAGVSVPGKVSVVGYDDIPYAASLKVPLTTVSMPKAEIGQIAAKILVDRIQEPSLSSDLQQVLIQPELKIRASTGAIE
jgi:LacI family transcriptional regulator, galactose operon repressor